MTRGDLLIPVTACRTRDSVVMVTVVIDSFCVGGRQICGKCCPVLSGGASLGFLLGSTSTVHYFKALLAVAVQFYIYSYYMTFL